MNNTTRTTRDPAALERRRMKAGRLFAKGDTQYAVAKKLGVSTAATNQWYTAWNEHGAEGLKSKGPPGFVSQYTPEKRKKLKQIVLRGPRRAGYATDFWTIERIRAIAKKELGVDLKTKQTWQVIVGLGFSVQRPTRRAKERDERAIADWKRDTFPRLKKMGRTTGLPHWISR